MAYGWYVDPEDGSYQADSGLFRRVSAAVAKVYRLLMTRKGSVPNDAHFGSNIRNITTRGPGVARKIEQAIDEALRPHVGILFESYERKCWLDGAVPVFRVTIAVDGADATLDVPITT